MQLVDVIRSDLTNALVAPLYGRRTAKAPWFELYDCDSPVVLPRDVMRTRGQRRVTILCMVFAKNITKFKYLCSVYGVRK